MAGELPIYPLLLQCIPLATWFAAVNRTVPAPYLDEVFHIRQAQHYCAGRFDIWDPKITTPPGLYLVSCVLSPILSCDVPALRSIGILSLLGLVVVVYRIHLQRQSAWYEDSSLIQHTALNVTMLPPLFFFSALCYTDVASTLSVLQFYYVFLSIYQSRGSAWLQYILLVLLGGSSLMFRQTNIFWVAIFPAALVLVKELDRGHDVVKQSMYRRVESFGDSFLSVAKTSWKMDVIYDPPVGDAWIEDYIKTILSMSVCVMKIATQPTRAKAAFMKLTPYLALLAIFAAFIIWNGSVVLGDKSNHTATLHIPQMLYLWPYFTFFSWPLLFPYLLMLPFGLLARISSFAPLEGMLIFNRRRLVPRLWVFGLFVGLACVVVKVNTVVHPFILADNRHYVFYVFRLLLRPWWVRYAVTPVYIICGWACVQALGARSFGATSVPSKTAGQAHEGQSKSEGGLAPLPDGVNPARVSFVLIWLATTALSLITAPLVEPRYCILPWIFWRIHLPMRQYQYQPKSGQANKSALQRILKFDFRLSLETIWFLLINAATGYIFLRWGFSWPQEPGLVQRFMW